MKWMKCILLMVNPIDSKLESSSKAFKDRYNIPDTLCFAQEQIAGYRRLASGILNNVCDADTKIIVNAHGDYRTVGRYEAAILNDMFDDWGIGASGLISFKSCDCGKGTFLDDFALASKGKHGYMVGYLGKAYIQYALFSSGPRMVVEGADKNQDGAMATFFKPKKLNDCERVRIVSGEHPPTKLLSPRFNPKNDQIVRYDTLLRR